MFITSTSRVKRGTIDGLGSIVKVISGNLDNDDAIRFKNEINKFCSSVNKILTSSKLAAIVNNVS